MPQPRQASPLRLALASALLCAGLLALRGASTEGDAALEHELRWSTQTPERAAQRFLRACASGQTVLARALAVSDTGPPCPALPRTLGLRAVFDESELLNPGALRLRGTVALHGGRHRLDVTLERSAHRWRVASARVDER